jgi:hypothetical protein
MSILSSALDFKHILKEVVVRGVQEDMEIGHPVAFAVCQRLVGACRSPWSNQRTFHM